MTTTCFIRLDSQDEKVHRRIETMLRVIRSDLKNEWIISPGDDCDLLITAATDTIINNKTPIAVLLPENEDSTDIFALAQPVRAMALLRLLTRIEGTGMPAAHARRAQAPAMLPRDDIGFGVANRQPGFGASAAETEMQLSDLAQYLHEILSSSARHVVTMRVGSTTPVVIDTYHRCFDAAGNEELLPDSKSRIAIRTRQALPDAPLAFALPGQHLHKLLWPLGLMAFKGSAPWLRHDRQYRLSRWPNFSELNHTMAHLSMCAALANSFLSVEELAEEANQPREKAQEIINALSLMGLLRERVVEVRPAPVALPTFVVAKHAAQSGLFARFRSKLGF